LFGKSTPEGEVLLTSEDIRGWLLRYSGLAVIPFDAFGAEGEWLVRLSVGSASPEEIDGTPRLELALSLLR
jgi:aspartate aminotransferase